MTREVVARAPTRIDLGGGWTDVPPYCEREGGFVCNMAITRYSTVTLGGTNGGSEALANAPLVRATLRRAGMDGTRVALRNDFPVGAGLGGSSAASAALLGAIATWRGDAIDRSDIAESGRRIEVEDLRIAGGRQDHYAATYGGALALTFDDRVRVRRLAITAAMKRDLVASATLIHTGESRISGDTISAVLGAYVAGETRVVAALRRMRELAVDMATALEASDLHAVGELLGEHWQHQRSLHPTIPTARIDDIVSRATAAGALGAKAMGASGGGCVLILSRPATTAAVRQSVRGLGEFVDFDFDDGGLAILEGAR